jgi:hypothetical protein
LCVPESRCCSGLLKGFCWKPVLFGTVKRLLLEAGAVWDR